MSELAAFLKALTPESKASLGAQLIKIPSYPFRIGRESRETGSSLFPDTRRRQDSSPNNDLYLFDPGKVLNISREHFQIEQRNGGFFLVDRNSMCGTIVEGETIGQGRNGGAKQLHDGDVIIVGTSASNHIFKFVIGS
jgi:pSer/pThr/pTyr-binding forkhead associated (FHA) protein